MTPIELDAYPRPSCDTGLALRLASAADTVGPGGAAQWLDEVTRSSVSWLVVPATVEAPPSEGVIRGLVAHGIEVIVELDRSPIEPFDPGALRTVCRDLARWGARYVALFRHANLASSWRMTEWAAPGLVERFGSVLVPGLEAAARAGMIPLVGALAPGGHYDDRVFVDRLLVYLSRHAKGPTLDRLGLGFDWSISNRPIDWGRGGPSAWPDARPYLCPAGSQDHRGFQVFAWYDATIRKHLGRSLPLFGLAGGASPHVADHPDLPPLDDAGWREQVLAVAHLAASGELPEYVFAVGAWPYTPGAATSVEALYSLLSDETTSSAVAVLRQITPQLSFSQRQREEVDVEASAERGVVISSGGEKRPNPVALLEHDVGAVDVTSRGGEEAADPVRRFLAAARNDRSRERSVDVADAPFKPRLRSPDDGNDDRSAVDRATIGGTDAAGRASGAANRVAVASRPEIYSGAIDHYLYLQEPIGEDRPTGWSAQAMFLAALDYIHRLQPTIGFRSDEAREAAWVTLVGASEAELESLADELTRAGRRVELIAAETPGELRRALDRLSLA